MKENLELLAKRFDAMASAREEVAAKKRWSDCKSAAIVPLESAATAYRICANEVRMLAAGGTPPVLAYRPKPQSKPAKRRKRRATLARRGN